MTQKGEIPHFSPFWYRLFVGYLRIYFARHFAAVRTSLCDPALFGSRPLVVYTNHPSWWDPIHFGLLASLRFPDRRVFGPMEAEALAKYRFFEKLGVFGVDRSHRGARTFLSTSLAILAEPNTSLWLTAEGQFSDCRRRPVQLLPGLAHLARHLARSGSTAWIVPLALEYPFWDESRPEALSRFGQPIELIREPSRSVEEWTGVFEDSLAETMEVLAEEAQSREPAGFETLQSGRVGVGGVYDQWRRLAALGRGESFRAAHGESRR